MSKNYFAIERNGQCWDHVMLADDAGNPAFEDFLSMSYEEMKSSERREGFVVASMVAANRKSGTEDDQTVVTLVGEDGVFIWGIIMGPGESNMIQYSLVDWKKDGKNYRYAP
jgi:hypothetical protein